MPSSPPAPRAPRAARPGTSTTVPASSPYDAREAHEIRRRILDVAHDLLIQRGYDGLSLREVARLLGKSSRAPYLHFPTKQELVWAMIEEALSQISLAVREAAEGAGPDPAARFEAMCRAYVAYGLAHPKHYEVVFRREFIGLPSSTPPERLHVGRRALEFVAENYDAGVRAGSLRAGRADERPFVTAAVIWATLHGAVSLAIGTRLVPGQQLTTGELVEATINAILDRYVVPPSQRSVGDATSADHGA